MGVINNKQIENKKIIFFHSLPPLSKKLPYIAFHLNVVLQWICRAIVYDNLITAVIIYLDF